MEINKQGDVFVHSHALLISSLNALLNKLDQVGHTVHCIDYELEDCADVLLVTGTILANVTYLDVLGEVEKNLTISSAPLVRLWRISII